MTTLRRRRQASSKLLRVWLFLVEWLLLLQSSKGFGCGSTPTASLLRQQQQQSWRRRRSYLKLSNDDDAESRKNSPESQPPTKRIGKKEGVYVRPSAAIERGSGFFIPGLEGPKVRLVGGTVLLALLAVNHVLSSLSSSSTTTLGNTFSEVLAAVFSALVLVQGLIEFTKENRREALIVQGSASLSARRDASATATASLSSYKQQWLVPTGDKSEWKSRVEWAAATYLSLTSATHIALLGPGSVVYWLGSDEVGAPATTPQVGEGCQAALDACLDTNSGRVALPASHPVTRYLAPENYQRCVILQRVDKDSQLVWMVTSNQLLASFTQRDLQWMGQLAAYMQQPLLP